MHKKIVMAAGLLVVQSGYGQGLPILPISLEKPLEKTPELLMALDDAAQNPVKVMGGLNLGEGMSADINQAILTKNWARLDELLSWYRTSHEYDPMLYAYAYGTYAHAQRNYDVAIDQYRWLLEQGDFAYVRFDLAVMLFENYQYQQAKDEFLYVKTQLPPRLQTLIDRYLDLIDQKQKVKFEFATNYEQNNNVNNASSATTIQWQGKTWQKSADSLPKKAHGVRYALGADWLKNIKGNHFVAVRANLDGVHYWDNSDYNEQNLSAGLGYVHQEADHRLSLIPFIEQGWLDGQAYQRLQGLELGFSHRLNPNLRINTNLQAAKKNYHDAKLGAQYDSHLVSTSATMHYAVAPGLSVFGGINVNDDDAKNPENASFRKGLTLGVLAQKGDLGGRISMRYAQRRFKAPESLLYGFIRQDDEYYVQSSIWHKKLQYHNLMPQLNFRYQKIDSNMKDLYSRSGTQVFISLDKRF